MLLHDLVVPVIIRRPQQLAGDTTTIDDLVIALRRLDLHLSGVEELAQMLTHHMGDGGILGFERQTIGHGNEERRRLHARRLPLGRRGRLGRRLALDNDDEAIGFTNDRPSDFEQLDRAARRTHRLGQRGITGVLRIKRDSEIRALVRAAILRGRALPITGATRLAALTALATWTTAEVATRAATKLAAIATLAGGGTGATSRSTGIRRFAHRALRLAEASAIPAIGGPRFTSVITTWTLAGAPFFVVCSPFGLQPLGTKTEALELAEVDLVEARLLRGGILVGGRFVHGVGEKRG